MDWTRRDLFRLGAVVGAHTMLPRRFNWAQRSPDLEPFVDPLPVPPVLTPTGFAAAAGARAGDAPPMAHYDVNMRQVFQKLHRDLPPTRLWAYHGTYIGPTFEVRRGVPIEVQWLNELPERHLLPVDRRLHGAGEGVPEVRTVVHLHGAKVQSDCDGHPEAWFTRRFAATGRAFSRRSYIYPNDQAATALWYHDHALGITRLNVYAGLAGFYLIRDEVEDALPLPRGRYEIPLMFQDRSLLPDGGLDYPVQGPVPAEVPSIWIPELFGDTALVNGRITPFLAVEPRRYRFRMLNACNARFLNLRAVRIGSDERTGGGPAAAAAAASGAEEVVPLHQIGTDQGLLPRPVELRELLLAPAERADVVIDFAPFRGQTLTVVNDAAAPFPGGGAVGGVPLFLQFRVGREVREPDVPLPARLAAAPPPPPAGAARRKLLIAETDDAAGNPLVGLLGTLDKGGLRFHEAVTESPRAGASEVWELYNTTMDAHPIHLHLVRFQIVDRQPFDLKLLRDSGRIRFTGPPEAPAANESPAWKDVAQVLPGDPDAGIGRVTRIAQTFDLPAGAAAATATAAAAGAPLPDYMWHCHILEHEDNEMMRPLRILPAGG